MKWFHNQKQFLCDKCDCTFHTPGLLNKHLEEKHDEAKEATTCTICNKVFENKRKLMHHKALHNDLLVCALCGKSFAQNDYLRQHMKNVHGDGFPCKICGLRFGSSSGLFRHKKKHAVEDGTLIRKLYQCPYCEKAYPSSEVWREHVNLHTKQTLYRCDQCDLTYLRRTSLYHHNRKVHTTKPVMQTCRYCKEKFKNSREVFNHIKANHFNEDMAHRNPYMAKCPHCPQVFQKSLLDEHINTHTGNKPHKCLICGSGFADKSNLRTHVKSVHKSGQFICSVCSEAFLNGFAYIQHVANHPELNV